MSQSASSVPPLDSGLAGQCGPTRVRVVDVLHRAFPLRPQCDREALARFLAEAAAGRDEQVQLVSQTLVDILPADDGERWLLEGFLAGRESLPEAPPCDALRSGCPDAS